MICLIIASALWWAGLTKVLSSTIVICRDRSFHLNVVIDEHLCYPTSPTPPRNIHSLQPTSVPEVLTTAPLPLPFLVGVGMVLWPGPPGSNSTPPWLPSCITPTTCPPLPKPTPAPFLGACLSGLYPLDSYPNGNHIVWYGLGNGLVPWTLKRLWLLSSYLKNRLGFKIFLVS